jgi:hypothetical protein
MPQVAAVAISMVVWVELVLSNPAPYSAVSGDD